MGSRNLGPAFRTIPVLLVHGDQSVTRPCRELRRHVGRDAPRVEGGAGVGAGQKGVSPRTARDKVSVVAALNRLNKK